MRLVLPLFILAPTALMAHPGHEHADGLAAGLAHPLLGLDHLVAMLAVGVLAALLGGRARWAVPGSFLTGMLVFGVLGTGGAESALAEHLIIASIIVLGALMALTLRLPLAVIAAFAAVFGAAHGYAHGSEGSGDGGYLLGFMLSTAALHAAGFALGAWIATRGAWVIRGSGGAVALAGIALAVV
ncbi:MAG: HupE/UreJ family protein [Rhodobacteraceae bacterium]|nr:HupE/UreJ family protein [Paracoccaceae bacterium]